MEEMLSSIIMISLASFAISVPAIPSANPTLASFRAGASLVPSPVTDTTSPIALCVCTNISLSFGVDRASTRRSKAIFCLDFSDIFRNSFPSMTSPSSSSSKIPDSLAMNFAVSGLSPVTILTVTPAPRSSLTASFVSGLTGSLIPTTPIRVMSRSGASAQNSSSSPAWSTSTVHRRSVLRPLEAISLTMRVVSCRPSSVNGTATPWAFSCELQMFMTISGAPLQCTLNFPGAIS
mmetsp:Transcript_8621/g.38395  ORF Transcript_8621/g.38395 Transcript_8621/m.38395 type:complete len:235 (-) Transcript_8621:1662-2366(-)